MDKIFTAINKETNELVNSLTVATNSSYQFVDEDTWYADPSMILSSEQIPKDKIIVKYRKESIKTNQYGNKFFSSPHFFIPDREKLGINVINESPEHKKAVEWIFNKLKAKEKFKFKYADLQSNHLDENNGELIFDDKTFDLNKIRVEYRNRDLFDGSRIADILVPFRDKWDSLFGEGIIIEIQFSKQSTEKMIKRTEDWAFRNYSVCWITQEQLEVDLEKGIEQKKDYQLFPKGIVIRKSGINIERQLRLHIQEISRIKDDNIKNFKKFKDMEGSRCPKCSVGTIVTRTNRSTKNEFYACSNFPDCKNSFPKVNYD